MAIIFSLLAAILCFLVAEEYKYEYKFIRFWLWFLLGLLLFGVFVVEIVGVVDRW